MKLFQRKNGVKVSQHITALDGKVIARKGDHVNQNYLDQIVSFRSEEFQNYKQLEDTPFFSNFNILLDEPKYSFISKHEKEKDDLSRILASVQINEMFIKELIWMKRYPYHYQHTIVITALVICIFLELYQDERKVREAVSCALVHDFGIARVPERILNKVTPLEEDEIKIIQEHPIYSYILLTYYLGNNQSLIPSTGFEHHENLQGTGYPKKIIQKNEIAQVIHISDIFDALITARPFRPAMSMPKALETMSKEVELGKLNADAFNILKSSLTS